MYQRPAFCAAAGSAKTAAANPKAVTTEAILMIVTPSLSIVGTVVRTLTKPPSAGTSGGRIRDPRAPVLLPKYNELAGEWRRESESNRRPRLCRPLHDHSAIPPRLEKGKVPGLPSRIWSGKRVSNSRPQPWQGCALPTELFPRKEANYIKRPSGQVPTRAWGSALRR